MFEIEYNGGNAVTISTKKTILFIDPKTSIYGLKDRKIRDGVQLATDDRLMIDNSEASVTICSPGEYEVGEFTIKGIAAQRHIDPVEDEKKSIIYRIECGDTRIGLIGNIAPKLTDDQLENIGVVDILIIPVGGGGYTLDATDASALVRSIDPKVVVPVHYSDSGLSYEVPQENVDIFVKTLSVPEEKTPKLKVKSTVSLPDNLTIYTITRS